MSRILSSISLLGVVAITACAVDAEREGSSDAPSPTYAPLAAESPPATVIGTLTLDIAGDQVAGYLENLENSVEFTSVGNGGGVYEVTLHVRGMTLDTTFSLEDKAASFDGFASETGEDTQLLDEDRAALKTFYEAIQSKGSANAPKALDLLIRTAGIWAETGSSIPLSRRVMGEEGRGWTLLCDRLYGYVDGTHDDWSRNRWSATSSYHVIIGDFGTPSTFYWHGDSWTTQGYDHASWPYEYGNCYGRCGSDCGSGHVYSQDCLDHDGCVRNGHALGSFWCDDEFASTTDDFSFAPNCY